MGYICRGGYGACIWSSLGLCVATNWSSSAVESASRRFEKVSSQRSMVHNSSNSMVLHAGMISFVTWRVRVRCSVVTGGHKWVLYSRGSASGLWLEGMMCSMLTVMLGGDLDVATCV